MIGRRIAIHDYKNVYDDGINYLNVIVAFKYDEKNIYIIYSYDNKKVYYGNLFVKNKIGTVMASDVDSNIIKKVLEDLIKKQHIGNYPIMDLNYISSVQIIDEKPCDFSIDVNKLIDITIPKEKNIVDIPVRNMTSKKNKNFIIIIIIFFLFFVLVGIYLYITNNSDSNNLYVCRKEYTHDELPASVIDEKEIFFANRSKVIVKSSCDYIFNDTDYYNEFKNNKFYKYTDNVDSYKFDDDTYTYRTFSELDATKDKELAGVKDKLVSYYSELGYDCKIKEE